MEFLSTIWDIIQKAKARDTNAIAQVVTKYQPPVLSFIKNHGFSNEDAEDISQEVFMRLFSETTLSSIDRSKGRFRDLILSIIRNTIRDEFKRIKSQKRGSDIKFVSIDSIESEPEQKQTDEQFDKLWVLNLVDIAFNRLKKESEQKDVLYYEVLTIYRDEGLEHASIAKRLGISVDEVRYNLRRAKNKLMEYLKSEIAEYSASHEEFKGELSYLLKFINKVT